MTTKELREKRIRLHEESTQMVRAANEDKREVLNADEEVTWQRMQDEMDALKRQIDRQEKLAVVEAELQAPEARKIEASQPGREERATSRGAIQNYERGQFDATRALRLWLLGHPTSGYSYTSEDRSLLGRYGLDPQIRTMEITFSTQSMRSVSAQGWEYRAQATTSLGAGGATVPDELMRALEIALLTFGGMRQRATVLRTESGAALPIPTVNDTSQVGALLAENTQVSNQDVTFAQLVLDAYKYSSKQVLVSAELLQDNAVNIGSFLGEALGTRIGRITNTHFTTGTGASQPNGIVTAASSGFTAPNADSQVTTWKYTSIVELEHSVDPAYRGNAAFMMHDGSIKKTKLILDTTGRPIWMPGVSPGVSGTYPDTLLGYPIVVNQDMAVMAANAKSVIFGDLSKYLIRDVLGVTLLRLDERYADFHQVAFLAYARMDGDLLNAGTGPVKYFTNAAS